MNIPAHAKRVFKGVIFDVYQWEQEMFDGSTQTFERLKRPNTVQVIPIMGEKLLLSSETQPFEERERMTFLGGRAEEGETPLETGKRELLEEAGMVSDDWELLRTYEPAGKIDWKIFLFVARNCKKVQGQKLDAGEKIKLVEVNFDEFVEKVSDANFWEQWTSNEVFRLKHQGKIEEYRQQLFGK